MSGSNKEGEENESRSQNLPLEGHEVPGPIFVEMHEDPISEGRIIEIPPHMVHVIEEDHSDEMHVTPPNAPAARAPFMLPRQHQLQGDVTPGRNNPQSAGDGGRGPRFRPIRPIEGGRGDGGGGVLPLAELLRIRFLNQQQQHQGGQFLRPRGQRPNPEQ
ncbi:hypothetical protein AVEN_120224-1 [Araneus ventricosus]|uniref:Uncharacterized protein n=1 Tax=Araneus ventricosus TaxID=182803 RepID=A0A4Y2J4U1_ARAVE|nr:hypothetical protein AVEN_120224-1 [Araneus ventricosus]